MTSLRLLDSYKNYLYKIIILALSIFLLSCSKPIILHSAKGQSIEFSQFHGKWIIINYWATWCPSCMHEIPLLNRFYEENRDKNFLLYGVNYDQLTLVDLNQAIKRANISFPVLIENPNTLLNIGTIDTIPLTIVINPEGKIVKKITGPVTNASLKEIAILLKNHEKI